MSGILKLTLTWIGNGVDSQATFFEGGTYFIGRDADCEIVLDDERVSRRQIEIKESNGFFYIKNIGRGGPIRALNRVMEGNQRARLAKDAQLEIADKYLITVVELDRIPVAHVVFCPKCQRRVDQLIKDCRWCGQNLAGAKTVIL